jgi:hypothetical protein
VAKLIIMAGVDQAATVWSQMPVASSNTSGGHLLEALRAEVLYLG